MKFKITLLLLTSIPLLSSAPEESIRMPNTATILCLFNRGDDPRSCFNDKKRNQEIAETLANKKFTGIEVLRLLHAMIGDEKMQRINPYCHNTTKHIMAIAKHCMTHPQDQLVDKEI